MDPELKEELQKINESIRHVAANTEQLKLIVVGGIGPDNRQVRGMIQVQGELVDDVYGVPEDNDERKEPRPGLSRRVRVLESNKVRVTAFLSGASFVILGVWKVIELLVSHK